jgi:hypothetical protein
MQLAREAHRDGVAWSAFWPTVAADCRRLQASCPESYRTLYGRLLAMVVSGDEEGGEPIGTIDAWGTA